MTSGALEAEAGDQLDLVHPVVDPVAPEQAAHLGAAVEQDVTGLVGAAVEHVLTLPGVNQPAAQQQVQDLGEAGDVDHARQDSGSAG